MLVLDSENWKRFVATVIHCERPSLFSGSRTYLDIAADVSNYLFLFLVMPQGSEESFRSFTTSL
jgi:hypothetical protein